MTPDPAALADWNAANEAARAAYDAHPLTVCARCHAGEHRKCTGRMWDSGGRYPCPCDCRRPTPTETPMTSDTARAADEYRAAIRYDTLRETGAEIVHAADLGIDGPLWLTREGDHLTNATDYDIERWAGEAWAAIGRRPGDRQRAEKEPF